MIRPALAIGLLILASQAWTETITGRVVGVADGDTITVLDNSLTQHKIRLVGIDAPERKQPYGQVSKQHLSDLIYNRDVTLDCSKVDRYKRQICVVLLDGQDLNIEQVRSGMAWWYRQYAVEQTVRQRADYEAAEATAKGGQVGLWRDPAPTPPWDWRHNRKSR